MDKGVVDSMVNDAHHHVYDLDDDALDEDEDVDVYVYHHDIRCDWSSLTVDSPSSGPEKSSQLLLLLRLTTRIGFDIKLQHRVLWISIVLCRILKYIF